MTGRPFPPTARERAAFDAATKGTPADFVRICRSLGTRPGQMLDSFDAAPWRWMYFFSPSDLMTGDMRRQPFPTAVRARLDATRSYVEAPRWRRILGYRS